MYITTRHKKKGVNCRQEETHSFFEHNSKEGNSNEEKGELSPCRAIVCMLTEKHAFHRETLKIKREARK